MSHRLTSRTALAGLSLAACASLGAALVGLVPACSSESTGGDAGVSDAASDLMPAPTRAAFGLDTRPSNSTCKAPARPPAAGTLALERAFGGIAFSQPLGLYQPPGDASRWFVIEQGGKVKSFGPTGGAVTTALALPVSSSTPSQKPGSVSTGGEKGLLGLAFAPDFATSKRAYLSYTSPGDLGTGGNNLHSVISRFRVGTDGVTFDPASEEVLLEVHQPYDNHNGGNIAFGPDGFLYLGLGDGGSGNDPLDSGQDLGSLLGKMLRLDVSGSGAYAIPPTNPFAAGGGRKEIYAWGLRNPWRWSFDRVSGELWAGDVGQNAYEEVDKIQLGGNYGWKVREGLHCRPPTTGCASAGFIDPLVEYPHADGNVSITGGFVYRGQAMPALVGTYLFADYASGRVWALQFDPATGAGRSKEMLDAPFPISSFAQGEDGELYVLDYGGGGIHRLVAAAPPAPDTFPKILSATGCADPGDATRPAPGLIPYDVNAPLWSDGADKRRWLALPEGGTITVGDDGDWDLPIGAVLLKEFSVGGRRVETRLFVRHDDGDWAGYSYEWNDQGTDATLLPAGKTKALGATTYTFPSRNDCLTCHAKAAGRTLGLETGQLNGDAIYPATNRIADQLATLEHIGLFAAPLPAPAVRARYPQYGGADPIEGRARAYLHGNCSHCHRPMGLGRGNLDLRFATPLAQARLCNEAPTAGDLGDGSNRILLPGQPGKSILSLRMHALGAARMPPLASRVVDPLGTSLVDGWISALAACP